jgi:hypothetical protein
MGLFDLEKWQAVDIKYALERIRKDSADTKVKRLSDASISIRTLLRPVDLYAYLVARFGEPNGLQSFILRSPIPDTPNPDSGNLIHWDFELISGDAKLYFIGFTREVHLQVSESLSDEQWLKLLDLLKADFARFSVSKSRIQKRFERWIIFQNQFATIADECGNLYDQISNYVEDDFVFAPMVGLVRESDNY